MNSLMTIKKGIISAAIEKLPEWVLKIPEAIERKHQIDLQNQIQKEQDRKRDLGNERNKGLGR